jgi:hypothetical protein
MKKQIEQPDGQSQLRSGRSSNEVAVPNGHKPQPAPDFRMMNRCMLVQDLHYAIQSPEATAAAKAKANDAGRTHWHMQ